jgi:uncharacterized protein (DUF2267 family)
MDRKGWYMTTSTAFDILGDAFATTEDWLADVREEFGWVSERGAYLMLRSTLHAVRDHLTVEQAARLGAALPVLVRGIYFQGWKPADPPAVATDRDAFLAWIERGCRVEPGPDPEDAARAVFNVLADRLDTDEAEMVVRSLPPDLRRLWP